MSTEIQEYSKTEAALAALREEYGGVNYNVESTDGLQKAKEARAKIRSYRTSLESKRKEIKAPALERNRLIDSEAKRITGELVLLEEPIDAQIKELEARKEREKQERIDAEVKRVEDIKDRITELRGAVDVVIRYNSGSERISGFISDIENISVDDSFDEFFEQARDAKTATLARLREFHTAAVKRETEEVRIAAEREELAKLRAAQEQRDAEAEKKRLAAEERATKKREATEKKEREKLEAQRLEQKAAQKKIDDDRAELEAEQAEAKRKADALEAEKKAAEEAEAKRKEEAQVAAERAEYPGELAIIDALVTHFDVPPDVVRSWLEMRIAA